VGACVWAGTYTRSSAIADKLSLTNRAMLVCKVVEVWQDFLSEYVDKQFTRTYATDGQLDMNESIMAAKIVKFTTVIKLCNLQQLKYRRFHVPKPTFLFPLETPLRVDV